MSDHSHAATPPKPESFDLKDAGSLPKLFLAAGVVGVLCSLLGLLLGFTGFVSRDQFAYSWLFGFSYCFTICVGALFWTCLHHATDAEWSVVVRRVLENLACLIPYLAIAFLPLLVFGCVPKLWQWWNIQPGTDVLLDAKSGFLNHPFFLIRIVIYFFLLSWVALSLRKLSVAQDGDGEAKHTLVMRKFGIGRTPYCEACNRLQHEGHRSGAATRLSDPGDEF